MEEMEMDEPDTYEATGGFELEEMALDTLVPVEVGWVLLVDCLCPGFGKDGQ